MLAENTPQDSEYFGQHQYFVESENERFSVERAYQFYGKRTHPLEAKITDYESEKLGYYAVEYEGFVYLYGMRDELLGGCQLQRRWNVANLYSLWLEPRLRGLGLGKVILENAERLALDFGANNLVLETSTLHSYEFYLKNGFEITNCLENYIQGEKYFQMLKVLKSDTSKKEASHA